MKEITDMLSRKIMQEFKAARVVGAKRIYLDNTDHIEVGQCVQPSLILTRFQKILKLFRLYQEPCYEVILKKSDMISMVRVYARTPDHEVPDTPLPVTNSDIVMFKRPISYRRAV